MFIEKEKPFYSVVQVAEILDISPDRLRTYDEENLSFPSRASTGKKRLYSQVDIEWLLDIRKLISKNRMNIYSLKLILMLIETFSNKELDKIFATNLDILPMLKNLKQNSNYKIFLESNR